MKAILTVAIVVAAAASQADLKSSTSGTYKKISQAFMKKDIKAFEAATRPVMTKDFKCTENGKLMSYDEMVNTLKQTFAMITTVKSAEAHMASYKEKGNKATSVTMHSMAGTMTGPDKKSHKVTMSGTSNDTWVKDGKGWKMSSMTWVKQTMTMDGKPFNPSKTAAPMKPKKS